MAKLELFLLIFILAMIPSLSHGSEKGAVGANRPIRSLLLLDDGVKITNLQRATVRLECPMVSGESSDNLVDDFILVYFTFESTSDLQGLMSHSVILKTEKVEKVTMKDCFSDSWVVPTFPDAALNEADGVDVDWLRDGKVITLCLVPTQEGIGDKKHYKYFGCVVMYDQPTNGNVPSLQIDESGKRVDK